jgi:hypothetical protein
MMARILRGLVLVLVLLGVATAASGSEFTVQDGDSVDAQLSRTGLTRISVQGARIEQIFSADGKELTFQVDKRNGQVFVRYKGGEKVLDEVDLPGGGKAKRKQPGSGKGQFSAFVTDDGGRTFNLSLGLSDAPAETITLKPMMLEKAKSGRAVILNDLSLPTEVLALMQVMASNVEDLSGYDVVRNLNEAQAAPWTGAEYVRVASYEGDNLVGEDYTLTNRSGSEMRMVESEFQGAGVLGVSVKSPILEDGQFTHVYIVREASK